MKFNNLVALIAIVSFTAQVSAQDGTLRRLAQNDQTQTTTVTTEVNTVASPTQLSPAPVTSQQPATIVEAAPVVESKAEQLRKARQGAEISTEQKIVEKLEESRLKEEQDRADRLFGNKLDATAQKQLEQAVQVEQQKLQPAPVIAPAPIAPPPAQVTIEKVEIVQPAPVGPAAPEIKSIKEVKEEAPAASVSAKQSDLEPAQEEPSQKWYVDGSLGAVTYDASNVKGNFGGGVAVGMLVDERISAELGFLYSNHFVDTFWEPGIFREMDQYDITLSGKYNILTGRIRPYIGAGADYIIRNYQQRILKSNGYGGVETIAGPSEAQTDSVNFIALAGADFQINNNFSIGAGVQYSTNIMNRNEFNFSQYSLPEGTKALEEIDFFTTKVSAKLSF